MTTHPAVRRISFVGESNTGKTIMRNASENLIPVSLELEVNQQILYLKMQI